VATEDIASSVNLRICRRSLFEPYATRGAPDHQKFTSSAFLEIIHHPHSGIRNQNSSFVTSHLQD